MPFLEPLLDNPCRFLGPLSEVAGLCCLSGAERVTGPVVPLDALDLHSCSLGDASVSPPPKKRLNLFSTAAELLAFMTNIVFFLFLKLFWYFLVIALSSISARNRALYDLD